MDKITKLLIIVAAFMSISSSFAFAATTEQQIFRACDNANVKNSAVCNSTGTRENPIVKHLKNVINVLAVFAGILAVILIMISGFTMITSAGNSEAVAKARKRLTAAVIGLVIIALSWFMVAFVVVRLL
jgi:hypothetical protein